MKNTGATRTKSFAVVDDVNGILTSQVTIAAPTTYTAAANFDGAEVVDTSGLLTLSRSVTITLSSNVGSYSTDDITVTGERNGATVTEVLNAPGADGGVTIRGAQAFDLVTSVALPAMVDTGGAIEIGVGDICAVSGDRFSGVEPAAAGNLVLGYGGGHTDTIPVPAAAIGFEKRVAPLRVKATTAIGVTVYLG